MFSSKKLLPIIICLKTGLRLRNVDRTNVGIQHTQCPFQNLFLHKLAIVVLRNMIYRRVNNARRSRSTEATTPAPNPRVVRTTMFDTHLSHYHNLHYAFHKSQIHLVSNEMLALYNFVRAFVLGHRLAKITRFIAQIG